MKNLIPLILFICLAINLIAQDEYKCKIKTNEYNRFDDTYTKEIRNVISLNSNPDIYYSLIRKIIKGDTSYYMNFNFIIKTIEYDEKFAASIISNECKICLLLEKDIILEFIPGKTIKCNPVNVLGIIFNYFQDIELLLKKEDIEQLKNNMIIATRIQYIYDNEIITKDEDVKDKMRRLIFHEAFKCLNED